jgi:RHS repeat-associated protein
VRNYNEPGNTYQYDKYDRATNIQSDVGWAVAAQYDSLGRMTSSSNSNGFAQGVVYDDLSRPLMAWSSEGEMAQYSYNDASNSVAIQDGDGRTTTFQYDHDLRLVDVRAPDWGAQWSHDAMGRVLQYTELWDGVTQQVSNVYDAAGRVVRYRKNLEPEMSIGYDNQGRRIRIASGSNSFGEVQYDRNGRPLSVADGIGERTTVRYTAGGIPASKQYTDGSEVRLFYDRAGVITNILLPDDRGMAIISDEVGRMREVRYNCANSIATNHVFHDPSGVITQFVARGVTEVFNQEIDRNQVAYERFGVSHTGRYNKVYDDFGRIAAITFASGSAFTYSYDKQGLRTLVRVPDGEIVVQERDIFGRILRVERGSGVAIENSYRAKRLTQTRVLDAAGREKARYEYEYDGNGRLVRFACPDGHQEFTYDEFGRVIGIDNTQLPLTEPPSPQWFQYTDSGARLMVLSGAVATAVNALNQILTNGAIAYQYDMAGNCIQKSGGGQLMRYEYDALANMILASNAASGTSANYEYSAGGLLISKQVGTNTTSFYWDSGGLMSEKSTSLGWTDYIRGSDEEWMSPLMAVSSTSGVFLAINDHLGDPLCLVDKYGEIRWRRVGYGGGYTAATGDVHCGIGQGGGAWDADSKLVRLGLRWLNPDIGSFSTRDPYGEVGGLNLYAYADGDPIGLRDPLGLSTKIIDDWEEGTCEKKSLMAGAEGKIDSLGKNKLPKEIGLKVGAVGGLTTKTCVCCSKSTGATSTSIEETTDGEASGKIDYSKGKMEFSTDKLKGFTTKTQIIPFLPTSSGVKGKFTRGTKVGCDGQKTAVCKDYGVELTAVESKLTGATLGLWKFFSVGFNYSGGAVVQTYYDCAKGEQVTKICYKYPNGAEPNLNFEIAIFGTIATKNENERCFKIGD